MGEEVASRAFTHVDRRLYRDKLRRCLDALHLMVDEDRFAVEQTLTGMELELYIVNSDGSPALRNHDVLSYMSKCSAADGYDIQDELGRFNLEMNLAPRTVTGDGLAEYEQRLTTWLGDVSTAAQSTAATVVMIGTLPTVRHEDAVLESLSPGARYRLLNEQILAARGEELTLDIKGVESLDAHYDSIAPEAVNTSVQFHLQLTPHQFSRYWNAAQAIAGLQLAAGANSPYLFGSRLWAETRIVLFEQATDTRSRELRVQGVRPRTFFGEKWIGSVTDLFEENLRYFPPLLPVLDEEDPVTTMAADDVPRLAELRLHNGTVYRWNRPVYDISDGVAHLRVENRVVPAGPTAVDVCANLALYLGLVTALAESDPPVWSRMPFSVAEQNFYAAARHGITARQYWPGHGEVDARSLVDRLLPTAAEGLARLGVEPASTNRLLSVIEGRCTTGVNGAAWQTTCVDHLETDRNLTRPQALAEMTRRYVRNAATNTPVHEWPTD